MSSFSPMAHSPSSSYTSSSPTSSSCSPSTSTAPASTRRKARVTAEHTLSRVRENQRRHRARQKDYVASLQQKLAETEAQLAEAREEIATLRRERETRKDSVVEEEHLDAGVDNKMLALERLVNSLPTPMVAVEPVTMNTPSLSLLQTPSNILPDPTEALEVVPAGPPPCCEDSEPERPTRAPSPECSSCRTRPAPAPTESTTLCAQAYVLIAQQNFRGIDAGTIRLWLYQGYRRARREGEGCRVENGALFRLLDYISGV